MKRGLGDGDEDGDEDRYRRVFAQEVFRGSTVSGGTFSPGYREMHSIEGRGSSKARLPRPSTSHGSRGWC